MNESSPKSIHYQCPGKNSPINQRESNKIHFPERPKNYPLDISLDVEHRDQASNQWM